MLGTAGSGKTTLAILRAAYLSDRSTDHHGKTLLVTFTRALVAYLRYLQDRSLKDVVVENFHTFARGYLASRSKMPYAGILGDVDERQRLIQNAIQLIKQQYEANPFFDRPIEFFSEEIKWISQHGLKTCGMYRDAERLGRGSARVDRKFRTVVFEIYEAYRQLRSAMKKLYDWDDLATEVCQELDADKSARRYRHVIIDEGQDFSPEMVRALAKAIPTNGSLTLLGDMAQQIYGRRMSWRSAGLNVKKVWELRDNYRNTRQVARLALAIAGMPYYVGVPDLVEPVSPSADGPLPTLVECGSLNEEISLVTSQATQLARSQSVAILFRNRGDEKLVSKDLPNAATRLHRDLRVWEGGSRIYYGTYHSSKGLEFDAVILPFLTKDRIPPPDDIKAHGEDDAMSQWGRLIYVGVTRARTRLIVTYSSQVTSLLPDGPQLYEKVKL